MPSEACDVGPSADVPHSESLVQAHLYEYQALTNRITYLVTMQYALWPVVVLALSAFVPLWGTRGRSFLAWGGIVLGEIFALAFYFTLCEISTHALYIDRELRPKVAFLVGAKSIWQWETWLRGYSAGLHHEGPRWWELWPSAFILAAMSAASIACWPWKKGDWVGLFSSLTGLICVVTLIRKLSKINSHWRN